MASRAGRIGANHRGRALRACLLLGALSFAPPAAARELNGLCTAAHDGDTITVTVDGRREKVRLIGIDTPELRQSGPWAAAARDFTRNLVIGNPVRLVLDVRERDRYGRLLAYVFVGGTFVNLELVRAGLAMAYTLPPDVAHADEFVIAQREAQGARRGFWQDGAAPPEPPADYRRSHRKRR